MESSTDLNTGIAGGPCFVVACVPGVTPTSWSRTWAERKPDLPLELRYLTQIEAVDALASGMAQAAFLRNPIDRERFHAIQLYTEVTVAVMLSDDELSAAEVLVPGDLTGERILQFQDDPLVWPTGFDGSADTDPALEAIRPYETGAASLAEAIPLVAAGVGVAIVPLSLARLHARKDLAYREITGVPQSTMALAWLAPDTSTDMDDFIGIIRGRTVNSTRGSGPPPPKKSRTTAPQTAAPRAPSRQIATGKGQSKRGRRPRRK